MTLLYIRVTVQLPFANVYLSLFSYICLGWQLCSTSSGLWRACDADQQRTKGVSHKVCLHVSTSEFHTSKRITANSTKRFNIHCLSVRPTACGFSIFLRKRLALRDPPTFRENTTFRVKSRPDFSCYLFDESWRRFTEFRGNPGRIVPRRRSGRG